MSFLQNFGSALINIEFIKQELNRAHQFIDENHLPVEKVEDDLYAQIELLENWSGDHSYSATIKKMKFWNNLSLGLSIFIALAFGGIYIANKMMPEKMIFQNLMDWLFKNMIVGCGILLVFLLTIIIAQLIKKSYINQVQGGKAYQNVWNSFRNKLG